MGNAAPILIADQPTSVGNKALAAASHTAAFQADIPQRGVLGIAEQAQIRFTRAVDGQAVDGMTQAVKDAGEFGAVVAHRNKPLAAPHTAMVFGVDCSDLGGAGIDIARQGIAGSRLVAHELQLVIVANERAVLAGQEGTGRAFEHDPLHDAAGILGLPDARTRGGFGPGAQMDIAGMQMAVGAVDRHDRRGDSAAIICAYRLRLPGTVFVPIGIGNDGRAVEVSIVAANQSAYVGSLTQHLPCGIGIGNAGRSVEIRIVVADQPADAAAARHLPGGIGIGNTGRACVGIVVANQPADAETPARHLPCGIGIGNAGRAFVSIVAANQPANVATTARHQRCGIDIGNIDNALGVSTVVADQPSDRVAHTRHQPRSIDIGNSGRASVDSNVLADQPADVADSLDTRPHQAHIAQRGVLGNTEQANRIFGLTVDDQPADGVAQTIESAGECGYVIANRHKAS